MIDSVADTIHSGNRGTGAETNVSVFPSSDSKVHGVVLYVVISSFYIPAALLSWVGEGGEDLFGRCFVAALKNEGAMDDRLLLHIFLFKNRMVS